MEKPSIRFSNSGSIASGVTSRPVKPVPPVVITTSTAGSAIQPFTRARMCSTSSVTMAGSAPTWPAAAIRAASVWPDLSSASSRVSDTVSTAIRSATKGLSGSMRDMADLEPRRREGVAAFHRAALEPVVEPAHALLRGAVGEGVGHDLALAALLQAIIADRRGGLQCGFNVAGLDQIPFLLRLVGPYAGQAVGLQRDLGLQMIGGGL